MRDGDRGRFSAGIAALLVALLITAGTLFFTFHLGAMLEEKRADAKGYAAEYPADTTKRIKICTSKPDTVSSQECIEEAIKSSHENQRSEADLQAQREMSDWAFWLLIVTICQTPLTVGGLIALIITIRQGQESNQIARESAQAQIRSYLMVESVAMRVGNGGISCDVIVRNVGESPATNVIVEVWIGAIISGLIKESDETEVTQGQGEKRTQGFGAIPKGAHVRLDFAGWGHKDLGIDFMKYFGLLGRPARQLSVNATLHGILRWEDVFNQTHCLGFNAYCFKLEKILPDDRMIRANGSIIHNPIEA